MKIELVGNTLVLAFQPTPRDLARVRSLPARRFDPAGGRWLVPHTRENWAAMRALGFELDHIPAPEATGYTIALRRGLLMIKTPWSPRNADLLRGLPDYRGWDAKAQAWYAKPTRRNLEYLRQALPQAKWDADAEAAWVVHADAHRELTAGLAAAKAASLADLAAADDYKHGGPAPWDHQRKAFLISRDKPAYAYFMEQRTGKTKVFIDNAAWLYREGKVRQALVIAPNSVKTNWVTDELPTHMPEYIPWAAAAWKSSPRKADQAALDRVLDTSAEEMRWLVMNVEALSTPRGAKAAEDFVKAAPTIVAVDESTRIKTPRSARTMAVVRLRKWAPYRRILTGTPATQGPLDLYSQFAFLDPDILGFGNFYGFRNHFAIMGGYGGKVIIAYQKLDHLQALIDPFSFRKTRDECFDIPPKGYQKLVVEMTPEQGRVYSDMRDKMRAEFEGGEVTATLVLTQMLRLAQIAGGFVPPTPEYQDGAELIRRPVARAIPGGNPKIDALVELAGDVQGKMVVWARFRAEIAAAADALRAAHGDDAVVEFHGGVNDDDRVKARTAFQDPSSPVRFLVGQTETGGLGINLDQARTIAYLSNGFSLESRLQSEDRASSAAQKHSVAVVDIIAKDTVDVKVVGALRSKRDVSRVITGDAWKEWI